MRRFLERLRKEGEIVDVYHPVDPTLEIAEIHRRVVAANGPALFFHNPKNSSFPVVTNLFGSKKRVDLAFGEQPIEALVELAMKPSFRALWKNRRSLLSIGTRKVKRAPVTACQINDLEALPMLKSWPDDGGHFITLPLVYTEPPGGGAPNLGMYRIQRFDKTTTGLHFQIAKGGGFHYAKAEAENKPLPVTISIGGPPSLILSAITPLPENVSELLLASFLQKKKVPLTAHKPYPLFADAEFVLIGEAKPHERRLEGPFGDHYGYYSLEHDFPVFHCKTIYHRKDAIYPATIVGKPRQEDFYLGEYLQKMLSPLITLTMPGVKDLWSYGETGFHALSAAVVRERYFRECMSSAFRILGEGQLSLTKFLLLTDQDIDLSDIRLVLKTVLERFRPETDLFIFSNLSLDTLDYTGPELNKGSRGVMLGMGEKIRELPTEAPMGIAFCPGCLVIDEKPETLPDWPLIILVDDAKKATQNPISFLWTVFTRFEPAADIHAEKEIHRNHLCYKGPILIDARMKSSYPDVVECDPDTAQKVRENWGSYFPKGMDMNEDHV